uniref:ATP-binding protein n=1 Tax=Mycobacterium marinum TaxID=1781 RepID=UPI0038BD7FD7
MSVAEVDRRAEVGGDLDVPSHFDALIPSDRPDQRHRQVAAAVLAVESSPRSIRCPPTHPLCGIPGDQNDHGLRLHRTTGLDRARIARSEAGGWLAEAHNVALLGPPGTGKTHLATSNDLPAAWPCSARRP